MRILALAVFLIGAQAHAGLLLEPYVDYSVGKYSSGSMGSHVAQGADVGGRVGYIFTKTTVGVDYSTGFGGDDASPRNSIVPNDAFVFVSYDFPQTMRIYGAYAFYSQRNFSSNGSSDTLNGNAFKIGLGFRFLPVVSLNVEYKNVSMTHDSGGKMNGSNMDFNLFQIGISAPFEIN